jgi:hypothetical protein
MTPEKMMAIFERQFLEGKAPADVERTCAGFAAWLATAWETLGGDERVVLTAVGAALWRDGYTRRAGTATKDPW